MNEGQDTVRCFLLTLMSVRNIDFECTLPEVNKISIVDITCIEHDSDVRNAVSAPAQLAEQIHGNLVTRTLLHLNIFKKSAAESVRPEVTLTYNRIVLHVILHCGATLSFKWQRRQVSDDKVLKLNNVAMVISQ